MKQKKEDPLFGHKLEEVIPDADIRQKFIDELYKGGSIFGAGSIFRDLLQGFVNKALEGEIEAHLTNEKPNGIKNRKNGVKSKKIRTESGEIEIRTPRDRKGEYEPKLVKNWERELNSGLDKIILSFYAQGQSIEDIRIQLSSIYGLEVSSGTISAITEKVWVEINDWHNRALKSCYPIIYLDAIHFKVRESGTIISKAIYTCYGVDSDGERDILGLYVDNAEGARYWGLILEDLQRRGIEDVFIFCVDGLKGFKEVINQVYPQANVQRCIVHMIRQSTRFVAWSDARKLNSDLRAVYTASNETGARIAMNAFESKWNEKYPEVAKSWNNNWEELMHFMNYSQHIRRMIYTTNPVEAVHRLMRKTTKSKGAWTSEKALIKQLYLTLTHNDKSWKRKSLRWSSIQRELINMYGDRYKKHL
ncbi:MAG: IS256 family transposase [Chitinophagales bacterium]|nr:IS256 family transposase [Chitinophagales bacterium]MCZ2101276.1 IS256 family transposase [Chitinophagales bacterium]MCZ2101606.1 IS256 family transposase [Chitinophagales bacterium]MCZ2102559.1 IS256 family transposase [Chitinophagales bacterium]MCZ2102652.1 IS256 family transposase [Chitinophagales bacterium]